MVTSQELEVLCLSTRGCHPTPDCSSVTCYTVWGLFCFVLFYFKTNFQPRPIFTRKLCGRFIFGAGFLPRNLSAGPSCAQFLGSAHQPKPARARASGDKSPFYFIPHRDAPTPAAGSVTSRAFCRGMQAVHSSRRRPRQCVRVRRRLRQRTLLLLGIERYMSRLSSLSKAAVV